MARHLSSSSNSRSTNNEPPQVHRILCYGDSLTAGTSTSPLELYPYAPHLEQAMASDHNNHCVVRHRGMPGWTADAMVDAADDPQYGLRSALQGIPNPGVSCVVLLAGSNDLGYAAGLPPEESIPKIVTPIQALHELAWQTGVSRTLAIAIPPSGYQSQVSEAAQLASQVNQQLEHFCQTSSNGKATFVPFPFDYERGGGANWCEDGLHFSPQGYQVLGQSLAEPLWEVLKGL